MTLEELIERFFAQAHNLSYVNLREDQTYSGWAENFGFRLNGNIENFGLDLNQENDLFLLFVLASAWSRSGRWENAAYFISYLRINNLCNPGQWTNEEFIEDQCEERRQSASITSNQVVGIEPRQNVAFRSDIYSSVHVLANNWNGIQEALETSQNTNDYMTFVTHIRNINGLGAGANRMRIKIPLILRELRCQNIHMNIPGRYCCVPDVRVIEGAAAVGIELSTLTDQNLMEVSEQIYNYCGDLYDLPLFAYEDLRDVA